MHLSMAGKKKLIIYIIKLKRKQNKSNKNDKFQIEEYKWI